MALLHEYWTSLNDSKTITEIKIFGNPYRVTCWIKIFGTFIEVTITIW